MIKKVVVHVTAEDLREGDYNDNFYCPIARGLKRAFPGHWINVGAVTVQVGDRDMMLAAISLRLQEVSDQICRAKLGQGTLPKPFWFRVPWPWEEEEIYDG